MITSNNGKLATTQTYQHEVVRGKVVGASTFGAFGKLEAGVVTKNVVWPGGAFTFPDQVTGEDITFVSTSAQDGVAGTGIRVLEIHYLDVDLAPQVAEITLNGSTAVTGQLSGVRFIQDIHIGHGATDVGTGLSAAGVITAYRAGAPLVIFSTMAIGSERAESSLRMVPKGKKAFFQGAVGSSISGTAAARAIIEAVATQIAGHQYLDPFIFVPFAAVGVQDGAISPTVPSPVSFDEGTVIGMRVTTDKGASILADWFGWLEDAGA